MKPSKRRYLLNRTKNPYNLQIFCDYDYIDQLSFEEQQWLAEFHNNFYCGGKVDPEVMGELQTEEMNEKSQMSKNNKRNAARRRDFYNMRVRKTSITDL